MKMKMKPGLLRSRFPVYNQTCIRRAAQPAGRVSQSEKEEKEHSMVYLAGAAFILFILAVCTGSGALSAAFILVTVITVASAIVQRRKSRRTEMKFEEENDPRIL